ncbi:MAG TPA: hypothetical protein PLB41_08345 [Rubrivivax sp.]|nr:hypothetical protein [Rubrivivax sp.]HPO18112.1 hypothetical protein [Rubrivivax sp.]
MKALFLTLAAAALCAPAWAGPDVGVSVDISQPGLYGRIDIGRIGAPPVLIYPQPVIISAPPVAVMPAPVYMYVPPGHARHWDRHCARYGACAQPVYFVRDDWVRQHYVVREDHRYYGRPYDRYDARHDDRYYDRSDDRHGHRHGHGRGRDRDD